MTQTITQKLSILLNYNEEKQKWLNINSFLIILIFELVIPEMGWGIEVSAQTMLSDCTPLTIYLDGRMYIEANFSWYIVWEMIDHKNIEHNP